MSGEQLLINYNLQLNVGNSYNFSTIAPAILQGSYTNAKLIAKGDYTIASSYANIYTLHNAIYPILINQSGGTNIYPNDPQAYEYYVFKLPSNIYVVLQSSWIIAASISIVESLSLNITVNELTAYSDVVRILNAIATLGYTNITSNVISAINSNTPSTSSTT
jgi:hypothetical protein